MIEYDGPRLLCHCLDYDEYWYLLMISVNILDDGYEVMMTFDDDLP